MALDVSMLYFLMFFFLLFVLFSFVGYVIFNTFVTVTVSLFQGYIILECQGEYPTTVPYHPSSKYSP